MSQQKPDRINMLLVALAFMIVAYGQLQKLSLVMNSSNYNKYFSSLSIS